MAGIALHAKVELPAICGDGMVLQQNTRAVIWGTASPGSQITVTPSWGKESYGGKADADGRWEVKVSTPAAGYRSHTLTVEGDGSVIEINDVLVGEVWLASGQSNMQMPMEGYFNNPVECSMEYICAPAATEKIRMFTVPREQSYEPETDVDAEWLGAEPSTVPDMSAVAFFFARRLNLMLDVPIAVISCSYGGSHIEGWLPKDIVDTYPDFNTDREYVEKMHFMERPYVMYNAMLHPVMGYTIKGFIWYQGCSEVNKLDNFMPRMNTLVSHWRGKWNDADNELPFYMVEIAPYTYESGEVSNPSILRQLQHQAAEEIPNGGIVVTNDLVMSYERDNIHPAKKKEVGERLSYLALNRNYGYDCIPCDSPKALRCFLNDDGDIAVELSDVPNGLNRWNEIAGLEVAGGDGVFYPVTRASMESDRCLTISHPEVPEPCQVRYGWGDFNPGNLANTAGLPVVPFWIKLEK